MTILKPHVAINVNDFDKSLLFYRNFFGLEPVRVREGYAKFDLDQPPLNFTINRHEYGDLGALNHLGLQVSSTDDVLAAKERLMSAGLATFDEMNTNCCYARQDKIWATDPDGNRWEVFVVLDQETDSDPVSQNKYTTPVKGCCAS
ncbi:VOC family protein [Alicyclobacillus fastidiosus]|uniref:VOC family protein n=1 Tax=Alicyclobacillus fastidiosus TaxID=392011 RepID=A0ABY6ZDU4_9BACL|nr:ArsI/CadI family heavy metal resistance metalloenzyme [Alicyclobacillus fastidiosus]WAH41055.1 VOC family protein [Alicyclobacillus fastidiosus]GMA62586.1 lactoylglutathione lyase [Alicyclobacillus fastidiosus]